MPPEEAVSALKKTFFFTHYMILRVYTVMHNLQKITYDITGLLKENVAVGAQTRL